MSCLPPWHHEAGPGAAPHVGHLLHPCLFAHPSPCAAIQTATAVAEGLVTRSLPQLGAVPASVGSQLRASYLTTLISNWKIWVPRHGQTWDAWSCRLTTYDCGLHHTELQGCGCMTSSLVYLRAPFAAAELGSRASSGRAKRL